MLSHNHIKGSENIKTNYESEKETIIDEIYSASYTFDMRDLEEMYKNHEFIAIVHVDDISPATTYREKTDEYIMPYTPGTATIITALKGDFASDHIRFLRLGGTVSYEDYQKSLYPSEREKLSRELKESNKTITKINSMAKDDISIEKDKTYIVYMNRSDDFHAENEYTIEAFEYGLREVKMDNNSIKDISKISIKNNKTGEYESPEQSVSKEIINQLSEK